MNLLKAASWYANCIAFFSPNCTDTHPCGLTETKRPPRQEGRWAGQHQLGEILGEHGEEGEPLIPPSAPTFRPQQSRRGPKTWRGVRAGYFGSSKISCRWRFSHLPSVFEPPPRTVPNPKHRTAPRPAEVGIRAEGRRRSRGGGAGGWAAGRAGPGFRTLERKM